MVAMQSVFQRRSPKHGEQMNEYEQLFPDDHDPVFKRVERVLIVTACVLFAVVVVAQIVHKINGYQ